MVCTGSQPRLELGSVSAGWTRHGPGAAEKAGHGGAGHECSACRGQLCCVDWTGHGAEPCLLWTKGLRAPGSLRLILIAWHGGCCFFLCLSSRICSLRSLRDQVAIGMPSGHPDAQLKVYLRVCTNYSNNHQEELSRADCSSTSLMLRRSNTSCCGDSQPSNYFHLRLRNCDFAIVMNHHVNI